MTGVFITARLGSTRLEEKHLIKVNDKPLIWYLVNRFLIGFKKEIENNELKLFITTSVNQENKKFESFFDRSEVEVFYGSNENIPLRHLECAVEHDIDYILSVDGDDILCSTEASRLVMESLLNGSKMAYTKGLPLGMNSTGYNSDFLKSSLKGLESKKLETGWGKIFDKDKVDIIQLNYSENIRKMRMTLDYPQDADFFIKVISNVNVLSILDKALIDSIRKNNWHYLNSQLDDIYWSNFNKLKEQEN